MAIPTKRRKTPVLSMGLKLRGSKGPDQVAAPKHSSLKPSLVVLTFLDSTLHSPEIKRNLPEENGGWQ